jgi:hypothetical protein
MVWYSLHAASQAVKQKTNFCDGPAATVGSAHAAF